MRCFVSSNVVLVICVATALVSTPVAGQQIAKLSSNPPEHQFLGQSVAIETNPSPIAVAGAPGDPAWLLQGKAYVFQPVGGDWNAAIVSPLTASDGYSDDRFGQAVATNGTDVFVGAYDALYMYIDGITEKKISRSGLGISVACAGSTVLAGGSTSAYLFTETSAAWATYSEFIFLKVSDNTFGWAVATDGTTHAVSAPYTPSSNVYLYQGLAETPITGSDTISNDGFGYSISIEGRYLAVGAPFKNISDGGAYIFQDTSVGGDWSSFSEVMITPSDLATGDRFGISVAIKGSILAVGGVRADDGGNEAVGAVWLFEDISQDSDWSTYVELKLMAEDRQADDRLGISVALSGTEVFSGAYHESTPNTNSGSAYLFNSQLVLFADNFESGDTLGWSSTLD
jgi:hypothetical protein